MRKERSEANTLTDTIYMNNEELLEKLAKLEFQNDQLTAELEYIDSLLRTVGFADGLASVKAAAQELAEQEHFERSVLKMVYQTSLQD